MVEAGEDLRLPREPGQAVRVSGEGVGEDLQGNLAAQLGVGGLPDLAHPALADEGSDVVVGYALQSHWSQARNCWADRTIGGTCLESEEHPRPEADLHTGATRKPAS